MDWISAEHIILCLYDWCAVFARLAKFCGAPCLIIASARPGTVATVSYVRGADTNCAVRAAEKLDDQRTNQYVPLSSFHGRDNRQAGKTFLLFRVRLSVLGSNRHMHPG